jgi:predicted RND superfamily exporter protein
VNWFRRLGVIPVWIADFVVGRPFVVLAVLLVLTAAAAFSARNLRFDFNPDAVFSNDNPTVKYADQFRRDFGDDETVIIIGLEATGASNVVSQTALNWQAQTVHALERIPHVIRVESLVSMETPRITFSFPPKVSYERIITETPVSNDTAEVLRERLAQTEMPFGSLVSKDYRMAAELVMFDATQQDFDAMETMVKNVDETLARFPVPSGFRTVVSGLPVLRVGIVRDLGKDQTLLMPLAGVLYLITLALAFRSVSGTMLPLIAVGQGLIWTFGVMAAWNQPLNIVSNILPCMLLINGVSNSIHVLTRYSEEAVNSATSRKDASRRTIRQMLVACLGAFATAAVGFFVLRTASSPVLQEFGSQAAMGLSFLYLTVILTLGALLPFFKAPSFQDSRVWLAFSRGLAGVVSRLIRWRWTTVGIFVAIAALALWRARTVEINSSALETYDEDNPAIQNLRLLENHLSGLMPLEISLTADKPDLFYRPDIYRKVAELQQFATEQKPVLFARSYLDYFNEINRPFSGGRSSPEAGQSKIEDQDIERGHLFLRRVADEMRYWEFMTHDERRARLLLKIRDVGTRDTLALAATLRAKMAELFPPGSGITTEVTGDAYVDAVGLTEMIHELLTSILTAALVIFGLIAILFRSVRIGLITIPPNVIPLVVTFGYMGLRRFDLNAGNVIVFTISLGIAVDNTIHYILRFREEFAKDPNMERATWKTMLGKGQPMCLATFLTVIGLAVLLLSDFVPTRRFAELTIVTLTGALIGALFLLPACVALLWKRPKLQSETGSTAVSKSEPITCQVDSPAGRANRPHSS